MRKLLFTTTFLLIPFLASFPTNAAEPIKLEISGYADWMVGYASQDSGYTSAVEDTTRYNDVDIRGETEIHFSGETILDNGLLVGVHMELEGNTGTDNDDEDDDDWIDENYLTIDSAYGRLIAGSTDNVAVQMHVSAPEVGRLDIEESDIVDFIANPMDNASPASKTLDATWINTDRDSTKISYITPTLFGLTIGASYIPSSDDLDGSEDSNAYSTSSTFEQGYVFSALYSTDIDNVGVDISTAYGSFDTDYATGSNGNDNTEEYSVGVNITSGGWTVGGATREQTEGNDGYKKKAYNVGTSYEIGPYAVSLSHLKSEIDDLRTSDEAYLLSGKYNLSTGVDSFATLGYAEYKGETTIDDYNNDGWALVTGLAVSF